MKNLTDRAHWLAIEKAWPIGRAATILFGIVLLVAGLLASAALGQERSTPSTHEYLKDLAFFIGEWRGTAELDDGTEAVATETYEWTNGKNFISMIGETSLYQGTYREIIGWDPDKKQITSWGFGTAGGHARQVWTKENDRWIATTTDEEPWVAWNGTKRSVKEVLTIVDNDTYRWESWWGDSKQPVWVFKRR